MVWDGRVSESAVAEAKARFSELVGRRGLPLASMDQQLNTAAQAVGIELVEEPA